MFSTNEFFVKSENDYRREQLTRAWRPDRRRHHLPRLARRGKSNPAA
ncbi:MAG: hypothetical protein M3130_10335 [Actinomycetota bacterium]|nr:hypothetical protein [Actinomycetota bacterium]